MAAGICGLPASITTTDFSVITCAALLDSINPCAIAVLLILIATLTVSNDKKRVLFSGLAFILGLFAAYFIFGLGLVRALSFFQNYARIFHLGVGIFAILAGFYSLKNFFWPPKDTVCVAGVCASDSRTARILAKITSPISAFIAGLIVTLIELPCTGGPYFFALGYLSTLPKYITLPLLLYYNLLFVLPLLIITLLIYFGYATIDKTAHWKERNFRRINLAAGLLMIGLGIWVILA